MCSSAFPDIQSKFLYCSLFTIKCDYPTYFLELCLIEPDASKYHFIAQGMLTIDGVDDAEEMRITDEAFDVLGFTQVCSN